MFLNTNVTFYFFQAKTIAWSMWKFVQVSNNFYYMEIFTGSMRIKLYLTQGLLQSMCNCYQVDGSLASIDWVDPQPW